MAQGLTINSVLNTRGVQAGLSRITNSYQRLGTTLGKVNAASRRHLQTLRDTISSGARLERLEVRRKNRIWGLTDPKTGWHQSFADAQGGGGGSKGRATAALAQSRAEQNNATARSYTRLTRAGKEYNDSAKETVKANRRQGVSFGQLLGLMIKFGIAMEIIMLPGRIVGAFKGMIDAGIEWEKGLANINALLRVNKSEITDLGRELNRTAVEFGVSGDILAAGYEAASSLTQTLIDDAHNLEGIQQSIQGEARATIGLTRLAAKAATAGATDIDIAMEALVRTSSGFGLNWAEIQQSVDIMFKTVDRGVLSFADLAQHVGELVAGISMMWGRDSTRSLKEFADVSAGLATMTRTLAPAEAFTSMRNLMRDLGRQSAGGGKLISRLKELGANLTLDDYIATGFSGTIQELSRTLMPYGTIIDQIVDKHGAFASATEEANFRQARSTEILQKLFPNIRTFRGLQSLLINGGREFNTNLEEQRNALGETNKQLEEQQDTVYNVIQSLKMLGQRIKFEFFYSIRDPLKNGLELLKGWLDTLTDNSAFREAGFFAKFRMLWQGLADQFWAWWNTGGKQKVTSNLKMVAEEITLILTDLGANAKLMTAATTVGIAIGEAMVLGIITGLKNFLAGILWRDLLGHPAEKAAGAPTGPLNLAKALVADPNANLSAWRIADARAKRDVIYRAGLQNGTISMGSLGSGDVFTKGDRLIDWISIGERIKYNTMQNLREFGFPVGREERRQHIGEFEANPLIDPNNPLGGRYGKNVVVNLETGLIYQVTPDVYKQITEVMNQGGDINAGIEQAITPVSNVIAGNQ